MRDVEIEFVPSRSPAAEPDPVPPCEPGWAGGLRPTTLVIAMLACVAAAGLSLSAASPLWGHSSPGQQPMAYIGMAHPSRVFDTRDGRGGYPGPRLTGPALTGAVPTLLRGAARGPVASGETREFTVPDGVVPPAGQVLAIEVTVLAPRRAGTLRVAARGRSTALHAHRISYRAARGTTSFLAIHIPPSGAIEVSARGGDVDIVVSVVGYIVPVPVRINDRPRDAGPVPSSGSARR